MVYDPNEFQERLLISQLEAKVVSLLVILFSAVVLTACIRAIL